MNAYPVNGKVVTVTSKISIEALVMLKSMGFVIKFIC